MAASGTLEAELMIGFCVLWFIGCLIAILSILVAVSAYDFWTKIRETIQNWRL